ncbi:MAG: hypothetical protein CSA20_02975 [Deltaproteobacteria bacterium]|nr:MAG: hypothetical protein CSA20_02975 [Deltaproteobacteria bacterium]
MILNSIVSITSHKGGVGKTVTTLNLGVSLAKAGHKVLLIDGDPQGNLSTAVGMKKKTEAGLYQVLHKKARQKDVVVKAKNLPLSMVHLGIDSPQGVFNLSHGTQINRLKKLAQLTRSLTQDFDITLIDTANNVGSLNTVLLGCSDSVIIPITCKSNSVRSLPLLLQLLVRIRNQLNARLSLLGLVLPMLDVNNPYELEVLTTLKETFPKGAFFATFIPLSRLIEKAEIKEAPVSFLDDAKELQEAYDKLSFEVIQRLEYKMKGNSHDDHPEKLF